MRSNVLRESLLKTVFRALEFRNFRLFFVGQSISLVGTWMQQIAMSWLVYRLTGSALILGVVAFASQIPSFILSPISGVLVDRWNRHRILVVTQVLSMLQAFVLAFLIFRGLIAVWHIIILGIFLGCVNSLDIPARQSFIIDMVEKKEILGNAIAINSLMFNVARLLGPTVAGMLIALVGEGLCFLINGVSFLAVIFCLLLMNIKVRVRKYAKRHVIKELTEGVKYTFGFAPIRYILILLSSISLMGMSYVVLMPVFANKVLKGGPQTLGFLMAAVGVGALIGTIFLASQKKVLKLGSIIPVSSAIFSFGLILFSFSRALWLSVLFLAFTGFGFMVNTASSNTVLQTIVEDDKRGRVMSFYTMAFMGMAPLGSLLAGIFASWIGVTNTLVLGGVSCAIVSSFFAGKIKKLEKLTRPIYENLGQVIE